MYNSVKDAVSVVTIQQYGYHVITSVVAHWLVINHITPNDFDISQFTTETSAQCKAIGYVKHMIISCVQGRVIY